MLCKGSGLPCRQPHLSSGQGARISKDLPRLLMCIVRSRSNLMLRYVLFFCVAGREGKSPIWSNQVQYTSAPRHLCTHCSQRVLALRWPVLRASTTRVPVPSLGTRREATWSKEASCMRAKHVRASAPHGRHIFYHTPSMAHPATHRPPKRVATPTWNATQNAETSDTCAQGANAS